MILQHYGLISKTVSFTVKLILMNLMVCGGIQIGPATAQSICNGLACNGDGSSFDNTTIQNQLTATPKFVSNGDFITQTVLRDSFPCGPGVTLGRYARVSDMYQTVASVAICETDGTTYYWRPQRTDYAITSNITSGTMTLIPFVTAPVIVMSSAPTGNITITPSTTNAWPGAQFRLYVPSSIPILNTITIAGLIGGGTITVVQGRDYLLTYTSAGWKTN